VFRKPFRLKSDAVSGKFRLLCDKEITVLYSSPSLVRIVE